jgi:hypothetical protein|tara:strand:+ start:231 stop:437 length:207 start_codon:yes stop_codon:yes gene_type:complete
LGPIEDVLKLLRTILNNFLPLYCELAEVPLYEYGMTFAGARASTSSEPEEVVTSSVADVSIDRASLLL